MLIVLCFLASAPVDETALAGGSGQLEPMEIDATEPLLEEAARAGPYVRADVVRVLRDVGFVRSYLGDADGARDAFAQLLLVDPAHALAYTVSPRATFLFEEARAKVKTTRAASINVSARSSVVAPNDPVSAQVVVDADPFPLATL